MMNFDFCSTSLSQSLALQVTYKARWVVLHPDLDPQVVGSVSDDLLLVSVVPSNFQGAPVSNLVRSMALNTFL